MDLLKVIVLALLLVGCSPSQRAKRHMDKAERICPECFTSDTILIEIPGREIAAEIALLPGETRTIQRDGISLTVRGKRSKDTIPPLKVDCVCDTIYKEVVIPKMIVQTEKREKGFFEKAQDLLFWVLILVLALVLLPRILDAVMKK